MVNLTSLSTHNNPNVDCVIIILRAFLCCRPRLLCSLGLYCFAEAAIILHLPITDDSAQQRRLGDFVLYWRGAVCFCKYHCKNRSFHTGKQTRDKSSTM